MMRKINAKFNNKDRVVCVSLPGKHEFFYQPVGTRERVWLFATKGFDSNVFEYFRDKGRNMNGRGGSLTIKELYEFKEYHRRKLAAVMKRIPGQVEYVIREHAANKISVNSISIYPSEYRCIERIDDERVA